MSAKGKFIIKKRGYDKLAVNAYIEKIDQQLQFNEAKLDVYRKQLDFLSAQLEIKQDQCLELVSELKLLQNSTKRMILPEEISKYMSLDEKVEAQQTADDIILEALMIAKDILENVSDTALNTKEYKQELLEHLFSITNSVIDIEIIEPLVVEWMEED